MAKNAKTTPANVPEDDLTLWDQFQGLRDLCDPYGIEIESPVDQSFMTATVNNTDTQIVMRYLTCCCPDLTEQLVAELRRIGIFYSILADHIEDRASEE